MHRGFITLHRKIVDWEWYSDINVFRLFTHLILTANWKPKRWQGEIVNRGQKVISIQNLAQETGLTEQSVRTAIKKLKSTGELTSKSTNKYTVVTLTNYELYQSEGKQVTSKSTGELTNEEQTNNKRITTTKQYNNITIKQKENNIPAFFDKKASDVLPFTDESKMVEPETERASKSAYSDFESFWSEYPAKVAKGAAAKSFKKAVKKASVSEIMNGLANYCNSRKVAEGFVCNPSTWLNQERWNDVCEPVEMEIEPSQALTDEQLEYIYEMEERIAKEETEKAK